MDELKLVVRSASEINEIPLSTSSLFPIPILLGFYPL